MIYWMEIYLYYLILHVKSTKQSKTNSFQNWLCWQNKYFKSFLCVHTRVFARVCICLQNYGVKNHILFLKLVSCPQVRKISFWTMQRNLIIHVLCLNAWQRCLGNILICNLSSFPLAVRQHASCQMEGSRRRGHCHHPFPTEPCKQHDRVNRPPPRAAGGTRRLQSWGVNEFQCLHDTKQ